MRRDELVGEHAELFYEESGGNPFYLEQLARAPTEAVPRAAGADVSLAGLQVPPMVAAALTEELSLLAEPVRRVLDGASVAGDPFEVDLAAAAADLAETDVLDAIDDLARLELVRETDMPRRFRFRHPIVRRAVYESTPEGWRIGSHERVAAALADRGAPPSARAHHVERSARYGDLAAVAVLKDAGEEARLQRPRDVGTLAGRRAPGAPGRSTGSGACPTAPADGAGACRHRTVRKKPRDAAGDS